MATIHNAAARNLIRLVAQCLDNKASVNDLDSEHGRTPLHYAAEDGHVEMTRLLLEYGAQPDAVDYYGMTPVELAEERGHREVVAILMQRGAEKKPELPEPVCRILADGSLEFSCCYCGEQLHVAAEYIGRQGRCRGCGEVVTAEPPAAARAAVGPRFEPRYLQQFDQALHVMFEEALPTARVETPEAIVQDYKRLAKAWRSDDLLQGVASAIRSIARKNLKVIAALSDFDEFEVLVDYEGTNAVQAVAHCGESTRPIALRIWRAPDRLFICGGEDFIPHP